MLASSTIKITKRQSLVLFFIILSIIIFYLGLPFYNDSYSAKVLIFSTLFLLFVLTTLRNIKFFLSPLLYYILFYGFTVSFVFTSSWNSFLINISILFTIYFIANTNIIQEKSNLFYLCITLISIGTSVGLLQFSKNDFNEEIQKNAVDGGIGSPNLFGAVLALCYSYILFYYKEQNVGFKKKPLLFISALAITGIVLSESRAALFTVIILIVYYAIENLKKVRVLVWIGVILLGVGLFFYNIDSSLGRIGIYKNVLLLSLESKYTGVGIGNVGNALFDNGSIVGAEIQERKIADIRVRQTHNEILQILLERGMIGVLLLSGIFIIIYYQFAHNYKKIYKIILVLFPFIFHGMFDNLSSNLLYYSIIIFILFNVLNEDNKNIITLDKTNKGKIGVIILILLTISFNVYRLYGYYLWNTGTYYYTQNKYSKAIQYFKRAENILTDYELKYYLGSSYGMIKNYTLSNYYLYESEKGYRHRNLYVQLFYNNLETENLKKAEEYCDLLEKRLNGHLLPKYLKALLLIKNHRMEDAHDYLFEIIYLQTDKVTSDALYLREMARNLIKEHYK